MLAQQADTTTVPTDQENEGVINFTFHDKFTNRSLGWMSSVDGKTRTNQSYQFGSEYVGKTIGDYINANGTDCLNHILRQISGYKYTGDLSALKQTVITGDDQRISLEYTRLSPIYVRYIDWTNKKVLYVANFHVQDIALSQNFDDKNAYKGDTFDTLPIDPSGYTDLGSDGYQANIPGYTYKQVHSQVTSGDITRTWKSATDSDPIIIDYLYEVSDPVVAKYSREHPKPGKSVQMDIGPLFGYIQDQFNYPLAKQELKRLLTKNGVAFIGGVAIRDSYLYYTTTAPYYYFLGNSDVTVNYINEATGEKMATVSATPTSEHLTAGPNRNPYFGNWTSEKKPFPNLVFHKVDRSTSGRYGIFPQEVNYYYLPIAKQQQEVKTATRTIHYVANDIHGEQLQKDATQTVQLTGTYFVDANQKRVNAVELKDDQGMVQTDTNGKPIFVVTTGDATETWKIDNKSDDVTSNVDQSVTFGAAQGDEKPDSIHVNNNWSAQHNNVPTGDWIYVDESNNKDASFAPKTAADKDTTLDPVYLIYKQRASKQTEKKTVTRKIHYYENKVGGTELSSPVTQHVTVTGTYYEANGKRVNAKPLTDAQGNVQKDAQGNDIYVVTDGNATETWTVDDKSTDVTVDNQKYNFAKATSENGEYHASFKDPVKSTDAKYDWHYVGDNNGTNQEATFDPAAMTNVVWDADNGKLADVDLIYMQKATTTHKKITRTIYFVTDDHDHKTLKDKVDQIANLSSDFYVGPDGNPVAVKKVGNDYYVDPDGTVPAKAWTVDATGNVGVTDGAFKQIVQDDIKIPSGDLQGNWHIKYAANDSAGSTHLTENNAPQTVVNTNAKNGSHQDVYLVYSHDVNADITYWDITDGMEHKVQLGKTDNDNDDHGKTGSTISLNNNKKRISDLKADYYVFVDTDYHQGDKYGNEDSHFNVYFRHAVKQITSKTPSNKVPKDKDGNPVVDPSSLKKKFTRNIYFKANTEDGPTLKDSVQQKVEFNGTVYVDLVDKTTATPETVKDVNGNDVQVATTTPDTVKWDAAGSHTMNKVEQHFIKLAKGDKYATSSDMVGTWQLTSGKADQLTLTPTSKNPNDETLVYILQKHDTGIPEVHPDKPSIDVKQETKTFIRTIVYRGTKDQGYSYEDVNGSPEKTHKVVQKITYTRNILSEGDKVLETTPWTSEQKGLSAVKSQDPKSVGYDRVDKPQVDGRTVNPDTDNTDLGTIVVTYTTDPHHETGIPEIHPEKPAVDVTTETKTFVRTIVYRGTKDGNKTFNAVDGSPDGTSSYKQTVTFTRHILKQGDQVLETTPWTSDDPTMAKVDSKTPATVGYEMVDKDAVESVTVEPDKSPEDLGKVVVTYRVNPVEKTSVSRNIYYRDAATGKTINEELGKDAAPAVKQTVDYVRMPIFNRFGLFFGFAELATNKNGTVKFNGDGQPVIKKDANGQPVIATTDPNQAWVASGMHTEYPEQGSPDLTKYGYKKVRALDSRDEDDHDSGKAVGNKASDPTRNGADVNVYYFHDQDDVTSDRPEYGIDVKNLEKTFIRTIVYRGTKDGGKTYEAVNGSPEHTAKYQQTVTFTRRSY